MQVTLTSKKYNQEHTFNLVVRKHEIVLTTPEGEEFATLSVETSERDQKNEKGEYETVPTSSFFVGFRPVVDSVGKDVAWVNMEPVPAT